MPTRDTASEFRHFIATNTRVRIYQQAIPATLAVVLIASMPASAETISDGAQFRTSPKMTAHLQQYDAEILGRLGQQQDKNLGLQQDCASGYRVEIKDVTVIEPIDVSDTDDHPSRGVWRIGYDMIRCGDTKRYNALFKARSPRELPNSAPYFPGQTKANLRLVQDTMQTVVAATSAKAGVPKECKSIAVMDMKVLTPNDPQRGGMWQEAWTIKFCDKTSTANVSFMPDADGKGTSFSISLPKNGAAD